MRNRKSRAATALVAAASAVALALPCASAVAAGSHGGPHAGEAASAIGEPGDAASVSRTIQVDMTDNMRFSPADIKVKADETIRFVVRNAGKLRHEMVLGTEADLKAHYAEMLKMPEMEHADPNAVTLEASQRGEMVWRFTRSGRVDFACLQPGHYDAGMRGKVSVR
ncbi:plastocyanin/azurin family copper-binding protein [Cupriavidus sp. CuC1]|uniref:cupredoxin domain-containing protein n=1 Tax=Cupriavidus sp. CuC1 TaxID=3373131 RepID=UPI0037D977E3